MAQHFHACYCSLGVQLEDDSRLIHFFDGKSEGVVVVVLQRSTETIPLPDKPAALQRDAHRAVGGMLISAGVAGRFARGLGFGMAFSLFLSLCPRLLILLLAHRPGDNLVPI